MDCRTALEILDRLAPDASGFRGGDFSRPELSAAEAHVAECERCFAALRARRAIDRKIGRVMRAIELPASARERLLAQVANWEASAPEPVADDGHVAPASSTAAPVRQAAIEENPAPRNRRMWKGLTPVAACAVVAAAAFFGVVWMMTPRFSTGDVCNELARLDLDKLRALPELAGVAANRFPTDSTWQKLLSDGGVAKQLSGRSDFRSVAVFGLEIPDREHHSTIVGLLAVVPRRRIANPPEARSLSAATPSEYLSARIGEAVSIAWTNGDVVCVCMIQGGPDSLAVLQRLVDAPAA